MLCGLLNAPRLPFSAVRQMIDASWRYRRCEVFVSIIALDLNREARIGGVDCCNVARTNHEVVDEVRRMRLAVGMETQA